MLIRWNKLYSILLIACITGYIWLYNSFKYSITKNKSVEVCLIKYTTNIPCPCCGSTRSIISLIKGNFIEAFNLNPIGYLVALIMLIAPIWITTDILLRKNSFLKFYQKTERKIKKTKYAIPLILLLIINWAWNIIKGL